LIIPAYNEAERLGSRLASLISYLESRPYTTELLVISDGSTDATWRILGDTAQRVEELVPVKNAAPISLGQDRALAYDPFGDRTEHSSTTGAVLDRDPATSWETEIYLTGDLGKPGVGIAIDAKPSVAARRLALRTSPPGWTGVVYAAASGAAPPATLTDPAWTQVATIPATAASTTVTLDTGGTRQRWYLIWITALPAGQDQVSISEIYLYR
jgi:serine/threonine-protein kinase